MKIKAIITGATGMVGEGVLHECLNYPNVESVLVINRKPCGVQHEKLKEIIHENFFDVASVEDQLAGYNACYFCAGVSSVGKNEDEFKHLTYDLTMNFANTLLKVYGGQSSTLTFCYVSGAGTDSSENGKVMWTKIKGKTENDLLKLSFKDAYMFRPGYIQPINGLKNTKSLYKFFVPFYPILRRFFPKYTTSLKEIGQAMINVTISGSEKKVLECVDITNLANN